MNAAEKERISDLKKCDFQALADYFAAEAEKRKAMTKEEKNVIKEAKEAETKIYGWALIDSHKQKIGNFRIEPPGLFRGRGDHPKMGKLKRRVRPEDVIINCSKGVDVPKAPDGHKWKEVRHDNTVTWLCSWTENVLNQNKYVMLNPSSKIKVSSFLQILSAISGLDVCRAKKILRSLRRRVNSKASLATSEKIILKISRIAKCVSDNELSPFTLLTNLHYVQATKRMPMKLQTRLAAVRCESNMCGCMMRRMDKSESQHHSVAIKKYSYSDMWLYSTSLVKTAFAISTKCRSRNKSSRI